MKVNRASNSVKSGGSTTTIVGAGNSALDFAKASTASADNGVSLANSTR